MAEFMAKLKGTTERGQWMTAAAKQRVTVGLLTAVSTIGLGAVLVLWAFPWIMRMVTTQQEFSQNKLVEVIERSITVTERSTNATKEQTERIDSQTERMDDLCDSHKELCGTLEELIEVHKDAAK
jgi:hypothetical protein